MLSQPAIIERKHMSSEAIIESTPAAQWRIDGETDPHKSHYDCDRAKLTMGKLTDDEVANGAFMNYDIRPKIEDIIAGKAFSPIAWMTAVKDRIRWLSRSLIKEEQKSKAVIDFIRQLSDNESLPEDIQKQITEFLEGV